ncbi:unnamed protein product [Didymodactylos carnosus]|uniref:Tyrosine-protein kinase ephrin type A/B receptor-like domain-containing protein n=1 Tax=Didymodactylos carnosus TaxID=1234261 RepID=A0A814P272_9BILA|nr:unnamed protein product [Didymodactylos carnosus]CAF1101415.1 unnamed protein product [Didymodactylos carnosus]CAF3671585.1 unnamed protein product [Didymodactylos carnosus]CAF3866350.1 unnamed protein product [Didymodactylos carnosus]
MLIRNIMPKSIVFLILILEACLINALTPNGNSYDDHGVKLAANDYMIVEAQNNLSQFSVQFYNSQLTLFEKYCSIPYDKTSAIYDEPPVWINDGMFWDYGYYYTNIGGIYKWQPNITYINTSHWSQSTVSSTSDDFIYSVAVGKHQNAGQSYFVFVGINLNTSLYGPYRGPFIGSVEIDSTTCGSNYDIKLLPFVQPEEFFVVGIDLNGTLAYGFATSFIVLYDPNAKVNVSWSSQETWKDAFSPHAVEIGDGFAVVAGFLNGGDKYTPVVYLLTLHSCLSVLNWTCMQQNGKVIYPYTPNSWQWRIALSTSNPSDTYDPMYDFSISINDAGAVLVGMQFLNTVYLFNVLNSTILSLVSSRTNGIIPMIGFGKAVAWCDSNTAVILSNNYSTDYLTWRSTQIEIYEISNGFSSTTDPFSFFPTTQQPLWTKMNPIFLTIVSTATSVIFQDISGQVYVLFSAETGQFADTSIGISTDAASPIYFSSVIYCLAGTYKNSSGGSKDMFRTCRLCPFGTYNPGIILNTSIDCAPCDNETMLCPLGAVAETDPSELYEVSQSTTYPQSPENTVFDDILMQNMFNVDFSNCLMLSPFFWSAVMIGFAGVMLMLMGALKFSVKCKKFRQLFKRIFRQTDLIGEGELWIGGLLSFSIIVLAVFAYMFSDSYLRQYPIENVGDANFSCDKTLRNAKFSTSMQSLGTPPTEELNVIFDMLDNQNFTLHVAFINTVLNYDSLTVTQYTGSIPSSPDKVGSSNNKTMYVAVNVTSHLFSIQFNTSSSNTTGVIRVGLTGDAISNGSYYVRKLEFYQSYYVDNRTLTQDPTISIELIKVINQTEPLFSTQTVNYSGLWIPTWGYNKDAAFYTEEQYNQFHTQPATILTITLSESTYYILNVQEPIAKQAEIIFHCLLFTIVCLEIYGLVFVIFKLILLSIFEAIVKRFFPSNKVGVIEETVELECPKQPTMTGRKWYEYKKTDMERKWYKQEGSEIWVTNEKATIQPSRRKGWPLSWTRKSSKPVALSNIST